MPILSYLTILIFLVTIILVIWRPKGVDEAIPAACGAIIILLLGTVSFSDLLDIVSKVSGAGITIIATVIMAIVLESFGFITWMAHRLYENTRGSGIKLFWYVNLLCFLMTLFLNNDGSILITTPILLFLLSKLDLTNRQKIPYLLSGALIATASSAPIGVSNLVNLIALKVVEMDLYMHTLMMLPPATVGLVIMVLLLYLYFRKEIPRKLSLKAPFDSENNHLGVKYIKYILLFIFCIRISLFIASYIGIPVELVAVLGSVILLTWRWYHLKMKPTDVLKKTPWFILLFAISMYVVIYGLHNIGLTHLIISTIEPYVSGHLLSASLIVGGLVTVLSNLFNNHPALMIGTLTLVNMDLDAVTLKVAYLASVIGSDVGSLLLPIGTLATLIWMYILRKHKVKITWKKYIKVTFLVIPPSMILTLVLLYFWVMFIVNLGLY